MSIATKMRVPHNPIAGAFSPDDLSGLVQWNKADDITGLTDGDDVSTWSAAAGSDFTASVGDEPIWKDSIINSLPVVRFAAGNGLRRSRLLTDDHFTCFAAVGNVTNKDQLHFLTQHPGSASNGRMYFLYTGSGSDNDKLRVFFNNGSSFSAISTSVAWETNPHLLATYSDGSGNTGLRVDGGSEEDSITGETWTPHDSQVTLNGHETDHSTWGGAWDLGELIIYNRKLSESEFTDVWDYLSGRWGVTV